MAFRFVCCAANLTVLCHTEKFNNKMLNRHVCVSGGGGGLSKCQSREIYMELRLVYDILEKTRLSVPRRI